MSAIAFARSVVRKRRKSTCNQWGSSLGFLQPGAIAPPDDVLAMDGFEPQLINDLLTSHEPLSDV